MNLITLQTEAAEKISVLRRLSDKASTGCCGRLSRSVRPIRVSFEKALAGLGFTTRQTYQAWRDVLDIVRLNDNAEEVA